MTRTNPTTPDMSAAATRRTTTRTAEPLRKAPFAEAAWPVWRIARR